MSEGRTLHVRCATWEQVETFHTRKLRRGKLLSMKVPFHAEIDAQVTLGLELPNRVVVTIDGRVQKALPIEGEPTKTWIEIELIGLTEEVLARIRAMADAEPAAVPAVAPPPVPVGAAFADGSAGLAAPPPPDTPEELAAEAGEDAELVVDAAAGEDAEQVADAAAGEDAAASEGTDALADPEALVDDVSADDLEVPIDDGFADLGSVLVNAPAVADELAGLGATLDSAPAPDEPARGDEPAAAARAPRGAPPLPPLPFPPPASTALPTDEHQLVMHLTTELRRLRQLAVHEVLGVDRDADADGIRLGWMRLVRQLHPDLVARYHAPAITHLAEELTILCNRAYDRLRAALVLEGRATSTGSVLQQPAGWLVSFEDISSRGASARFEIIADEGEAAPPPLPPRPDDGPPAPAPPPPDGAAPSVVQGGEAFENRARMMLSNGDADHAQEVLAAALCVYPRSRPLRSLYYVAAALSALSKGERMLATSQLETALAHYEHCVEAAQILEYMRRHALADHVELRRFFR